ncbi:MAG: helix-turn-helix domain-containing protein [Chloroflexota bacterium]
MSKYGQFCPVARALEVLGDRWTLLIIRDMLLGTTQFNDLERGLPGISRALLSARLRQLQQAGVIEKRINPTGRKTTEYQLTEAGRDLQDVIGSLMMWGGTWAFGEPTPEELDPILLMWWLRKRVQVGMLPDRQIVVQFDLSGGRVPAGKGHAWLLLTAADVTLCLTDPGFEVDVLVTADMTTFFKLWWAEISYQEALSGTHFSVDGLPAMTAGFPIWFGWNVPQRSISSLRKLHQSA